LLVVVVVVVEEAVVLLGVSIGRCCCGAGIDADGGIEALLELLVVLMLLLVLVLSNPTTPVNWEKSKSGRLRSPVFVSTGKYLSNSFCQVKQYD
jgi:hypothetical protein